ncbi:MAG: DNA topoisomerase III [Clostridiales bacterium 38-18]|nr:MAG: DNA topoisomerase III [Clostridiales bacterium 38-18]
MKVIIAEKPSVAKNIADAVSATQRRDGYFEGNGFYVTWAFGHLLELFDAKDYDEALSSWRMTNFPFIPDGFKYKVKHDSNDRSKVDQGALKQISTIENLINQPAVEAVINACDYDREGQIIGDIIIDYLKVEKPVERLLLNEWTPEEVSQGLKKTVNNIDMRPLKDAGIGRQWADWIIGINLTSVATLKYKRGGGKPLNIGRVLMPTLKIIYDRDMEIANFVKEEFHKLTAKFLKEGVAEPFDAVYMLDGKDKFEDKEALERLKKALTKAAYVIDEKIVEQKREYPPSLFNLSGLQGYVTGKYKGWTSEKVLKVAQELYEKKLITYPRTASLALEESLIDKASKVLNVHKRGLPYENEVAFSTSKRIFDNSKVESHSAIIPTYIVGNKLSPDEKIVYEAVKNRFIMQFMPVAEHEEVNIWIKATPSEPYDEALGLFNAKGRTQLVEGWRKVEKIQSKEKFLPELSEGESVTAKQLKIETKGTTPPKHHTEKTLLKVMETCGKKSKSKKEIEASESESDGDTEDGDELDEGLETVEVNASEDIDAPVDNEEEIELLKAILSGYSIGTPATRAETIAKLKRVGYIGVKGKSLFCTDMGKRMVEQFPVKTLFDLEYTGRLEKTLSDISKGEVTRDAFMSVITDFTTEAVATIKGDAFHVIDDSGEKGKDYSDQTLGNCPACGSPVVEGEKGFGCTNWKGGCKFVVWKEDRFLQALKVRATRQTVERLLENGELYSNSFVNKKGEKFSAHLTYVKNEESGYYNWKMHF